jgi:transcriptional regulator with XRE-family HTH domain
VSASSVELGVTETSLASSGDRTNGRDRVRAVQYWIVTFDGTRLRQRRKELGLSQERLAYRSRVSHRSIQRIELLPEANCHVRTLRRLACALSSDPDGLIAELMAGCGEQPQAEADVPRTPGLQPRVDRWWQQAAPFPSDRQGRPYDAAMARQLLRMTGEFPNTKGGLLRLLSEYRRALRDMAVAGGDGSQSPTLAQMKRDSS